MPRMLAASRGASSFCTIGPLRICRILHLYLLVQYVFIRFVGLVTLVPQGLTGFQSVGDALLGFLFAAEGDEGFAFEIEDVLFADQLWRGQRTAGKDVRQLAVYVCVIFRGVAAAEHHVDRDLC